MFILSCTSIRYTRVGGWSGKGQKHPYVILRWSLIIFFQNREEGSGGCTLRKSVYRKGLFHLMNETINPGILSKS